MKYKTQLRCALAAVFMQALFGLGTIGKQKTQISDSQNSGQTPDGKSSAGNTPIETRSPNIGPFSSNHSNVSNAGTSENSSVIDNVLDSPMTNSFQGLSSTCLDEASQRLCGCTSACLDLRNCCYDSDFSSWEDNSNSTRPMAQYSCFENFGKKFTFPSPSLLVDKCQPSWKNASVKQLCEFPNVDDFRSAIPCFSEESGLVYRNIYCLECNYLTQCSPWLLFFEGLADLPFGYMSSFDKMLEVAGRSRPTMKRFHFVLRRPPDHDPVHCLPDVTPVHVHQVCSNSTPELSRFCQAYYSPMLIGGTFYRNIHCFKCSNNNEFEIKMVRSPGQSTLSVMLKLQWTNKLPGEEDGCHGSACKPLIREIRGYSELLFVVCNTAAERHLTVPNQENFHRMKTMAEGVVNSALETLLSNFTLLIKDVYQPEYGNLSRFDFVKVPTISDELKLERILEIRNTIENLTFKVNMARSLSVNCRTHLSDDDSTQQNNEEEHAKKDSTSSLAHRNKPFTSPPFVSVYIKVSIAFCALMYFSY